MKWMFDTKTTEVKEQRDDENFMLILKKERKKHDEKQQIFAVSQKNTLYKIREDRMLCREITDMK
jgi:hypothetical protein